MEISLDINIDCFIERNSLDELTDVVERYASKIRDEYAFQGWDYMVTSTNVFKKPTGNYKAHIIVEKEADKHTLTDQNIIYGPWLERGGRGGFQGYHLWKECYKHLERVGPKILEKEQKDLIRELGK